MTTNTTPDIRTDYWQEQIRAWQTFGQSQRAYCQANDLNYLRFGYWLRKFRQQAEWSEPTRSGFVPVTRAATATPGGLALVLPNGIELRGVNHDNLSLVEQLLNRWA
ncbi:MAG: IS66 family insertion sequence element accessory protein TnpB [Candidatus Thiodiazotropha endolucinida]|uniref:IS66 family insertion sequence element accessory protein TnpB n=1 Tax=Candidatus Thiodiazotropha taylori TaxID=2792791 RepID=A0A9E4NQG6_9GAMM|nr:IS66 family insertion sequence element accessory protein TnpB [Candidatus Thiodiazotropha taylori]MCG8097003.1 IS66 family insertion sequence element accessory protein TnpB [Candidatus Thiodiazotropha endolucinida]MCG7891243.1 IS66 family insertion sequence element accessory protein TnpB [Candidatus Thiodiazotropha taylori]MCG7952541.1 IS66 family insertion sequence element accessory protein TnpB [Candidatus Thiodiazotropha taylori]MCG7981067.1 IS66 family insertion sequence element accessor